MTRKDLLREMEIQELSRMLLKEALSGTPTGDEIQIVDDEIQAISVRQEMLSNEYWMNVQNWNEREVLAAMADMRAAIKRVRWFR